MIKLLAKLFIKNSENYSDVKVRDKFIKIKVRYSGEDLVIITALQTLLNISYS